MRVGTLVGVPTPSQPSPPSVALVTLGCARNEVDSEEIAGRLARDGWRMGDPDSADVLVVNTCGFVEGAKKDSIDTLLQAADTGRRVVAVGCLAERYGAELAGSLPEVDAVLGFDHYPDLGARLSDVLAGRVVPAHRPRDRRTLLPISPVDRPAAPVVVPGHGDPAGVGTAAGTAADTVPDTAADAGPRYASVLRHRLDASPVAPVKLASGCDRRCAFCAIPSFRGAFVSRPPEQLRAEARWLVTQGVAELVLVSENSTSYGKDLGDLRLLESLLPELAGLPGVARVRVSYLQPAELRPSLLAVIATTPGVAPYFDLSFQHASEPVLRRMRRFGSAGSFLDLLARIRALAPDAGARSNVIVGFPGETEADLASLEHFLVEARLDAVGVFGYSDEDGTEATGYAGKLDADEIAARVGRVSRLTDELCAQRAEDRIGSRVEVLVESVPDGPRPGARPVGGPEGRAAHQGPEDGTTVLRGAPPGAGRLRVGDLVAATVVGTDGVDLLAEPVEVLTGSGTG
ncbi:MAG TPA: radical SAM protein [Mycobacteriales bacterium]|nr:radical SAM protein [Mycobacteriales bacterium]